ncbi:hypothetical protein HK405_011166, partial [Cladochytrium tenue]
MDAIDLDLDLHYFAAAGGFALNPEERAALAASLRLKAAADPPPASSFSSASAAAAPPAITLWGKILGLQRDYWIASAPAPSAAAAAATDAETPEARNHGLFARRFYYSTDLAAWLLLPDLTRHELDAVDAIAKRFTGDPAFEYPNPNAPPADPDAAE